MVWHLEMSQIPDEVLMEASMTKSVIPRNRVHWYFPYDLIYLYCFFVMTSFVLMTRIMIFKLYIHCYIQMAF